MRGGGDRRRAWGQRRQSGQRARARRAAAERDGARRYELLAQHSRDIVLLLSRDGRILEANAAATAAYGRTREELLALTIHDLRADRAKDVAAGQMAEADERGIAPGAAEPGSRCATAAWASDRALLDKVFDPFVQAERTSRGAAAASAWGSRS